MSDPDNDLLEDEPKKPTGPVGWVCPVCGDANSPYNSGCVSGPHINYRVAASTNYKCNCHNGQPSTTFGCPVHGVTY